MKTFIWRFIIYTCSTKVKLEFDELFLDLIIWIKSTKCKSIQWRASLLIQLFYYAMQYV